MERFGGIGYVSTCPGSSLIKMASSNQTVETRPPRVDREQQRLEPAGCYAFSSCLSRTKMISFLRPTWRTKVGKPYDDLQSSWSCWSSDRMMETMLSGAERPGLAMSRIATIRGAGIRREVIPLCGVPSSVTCLWRWVPLMGHLLPNWK